MGDKGTGDVLVLRRDLNSRVVVAILLLLTPPCFLLILTSAAPSKVLGLSISIAIYAVLCIALTIKWLQLRVELSDTSLRTVGWLTSREIPRSAIVDLAGGPNFPIINWIDATGRRRWTVIDALMPGSSRLPAHRRDIDANREALIAWIDGN
jgi:hypothetical protein